jgi:hypothetical protein
VAKEQQVKEAIQAFKNRSATGMDRCLYELWKKLILEHENRTKKNKSSFNISQMLAKVMQDIQTNGVDMHTHFMLGWMCPIYKKKDLTEISNY